MPNDVYRISVPEDFKEFTYPTEDVRELHLKPTDFDDDDDDHEVVLFQLPLELDVKHLHNRAISLLGQSTCECGDDADVTNVMARSSIPDEIKTLLLLIPDSKTGNLIPTAAKFKKYVVMTKSTVAPKIEYPTVDDSEVPFPEDLRVRYEPFGAGDPALISTKRKSSKTSQKPLQEPTQIKSEKRKHKKDGDDDAADGPKKKRHKKDGDEEMNIKSGSSDSYNRELENMEEPAMESPRKKKHNKPEIKQEPLSSESESKKQKTKHKKRKIKEEPLSSESESKKQKTKHKKLKIKQETLSSESESDKRKTERKKLKIKQEPVSSESELERRGKKKKH